MLKVVIDTNVLVSALIQKSYPFLIIDQLFIENKFLLYTSNEILAEYYEVLSRKKFSKYSEFKFRAETLLADIEAKALNITTNITIKLIKDVDDNKFLELAETCNADFIITGNTNDFTFAFYKQTQIVTPKQFWDIFNEVPA